MPDVPSSAEAGLPGLQTLAWTALFLPRATPKAIVARINAAVDGAMRDAAVEKSLAKLGADLPPPDQRTPQVLATLVGSEVGKWVPLLRAAGVVGE
jgi:tripartite-type tricarboxylate transporter receptor subunit TctC